MYAKNAILKQKMRENLKKTIETEKDPEIGMSHPCRQYSEQIKLEVITCSCRKVWKNKRES